MSTVTLHWTNGSTTSFETADPKVIARYQVYAERDPGIKKMTVRRPGDPEPDDDDTSS